MKVKRKGRDTEQDAWCWVAQVLGASTLTLSTVYFFSCSMTCLACAASGDVGSTAMTFSIILIVPSLSPLFSDTSASLNSGLPQDGVLVNRLLIPRGRFVGLPFREFHLAEVVEHFARRRGAVGRLLQRLLGGGEVALFHVRHADADDRFVVGRVGFQQFVVRGDRVVVLLLVAIGGRNLQVDDASAPAPSP